MAGLGKTLAELSHHRQEWKKLLQAGHLHDGYDASLSRHLIETTDFGANPGQLKMLSYVPPQLSAKPALVVVLHGCKQNAHGYDLGSGWSAIARRHGFAVLLPEQQRGNNPNMCFDWFQLQDIQRGQGEAASIRSMIETMIGQHQIDRDRVFVTGLSAGGAMTSVMLATYPDVFAGGAIIAGLPYRSATDIPDAFRTMSEGKSLSASAWGDLVRSASSHKGPWPKVSVWHGTADQTVNVRNAGEIVKQWQSVHGILGRSTVEDTVDGYPHRVWRSAAGEDVIEEYLITGLSHGTPLATGPKENQYGAAGPYLLEAGISSSYHIAKFWGLTQEVFADSGDETKPQESAQAPRVEPAMPHLEDVSAVIAKALRKAGLM